MEPYGGGWGRVGRGAAGAEGRAALRSAWEFERKAQADSGGIPYGAVAIRLRGPGSFGSTELRRLPSGQDFRLAGESRRVAEAGEAQAAPPGWAPRLPGRAQDASSQGRWGPRVPTWGEGSAPPPPRPGPGPEPCRPERSFYFDGTLLTRL